LPRGQLEWLKLPSPVGGGVGVWDGTVVGGVDEEGEPPSPQEDVSKTIKLAAATAVEGIRLRKTNMEIILPECTVTGGSNPNCTPLCTRRQALWRARHKL
jgi:hypothetical protein